MPNKSFYQTIHTILFPQIFKSSQNIYKSYLIGRQNRKHAAHNADGSHGRAAERGQVHGCQRSSGVCDTLVDKIGQTTKNGDSAQGVHMEGIAPT